MRKYRIKKKKENNYWKKKISIGCAILCSIILFSSYLILLNNYLGSMNEDDVMMRPVEPPFTKKEVSISTLLNAAKKQNISIYLPSDLPNNFELTAIYLRENSFFAIILYSSEGIKDLKTAELGIEIAYTSDPPTLEELSSKELGGEKKVLEINGWPVYINGKAYGDSSEEAREKFGLYTVLADVWIGNTRHSINAPTLTEKKVIDLISSMSLKIED